jgi:DNA-binding MarR family transcriptional regulator
MTLRRTTRAVTEFYDLAVERNGLLITQYALLKHILLLEPATLHALSESLGLERSTLARNVAVLERQGFVRSAAQRKAREHRIETTDKGRLKFKEAQPFWEEAQRGIEELLTEDELGLLRNIARKLQGLAARGKALPDA